MENLKFEKIDGYTIPEEALVKVTEQGNITKLQFMEKQNSKCNIKKVDKERYVLLETGEVLQFANKATSRMSNLRAVRTAQEQIRALVNTNCKDADKVLWVCLTYSENMKDTKRLYKDFHDFVLRLYRYCNRKGLGKPEYISVPEPQGRGAWHCHVFLLFDKKYPYISNSDLSTLWGHGYVTVKSLKESDNAGAYLTAYLTDYDLQEAIDNGISFEGVFQLKEKIVDGKEKKFLKGARLLMYPPGMNMYRCSRGILKPKVYKARFSDMKKANLGQLTFSKTFKITSDSDFETVVCKQYYNKLRKTALVAYTGGV